MAASLGYVLSQLQRWTSPRLGDLPDAVLLERFVGQRDESAFAALVARHGGMVLRSCHRILGDTHAAEDAFQATFLVLAQRAHALRRPAGLPGFLHSVARRVSVKARAKAAICAGNSPLTEEAADSHSDPLMQLTARELLKILDEEIARLPAAQRSALVLCSLEGHTREEAAHILGCTDGAIKGHLQRGRQRLQKRLRRRGIDLSAALALVMVAREGIAAHVPELLLQSTVRAALHGAIGGTASAWANSVLQGMGFPKLAGLLAVTLTIGLAASATVALVYHGSPSNAPEAKAPQTEEPRQSPQAVRVDRLGDPLPEGALLRLGTIRYRAAAAINEAALSPDGKILATACESGITLFDLATGKPRHLRDSAVPNGFDVNGSKLSFSPDGKQLVSVTHSGNLRFWDVAAGKLLRVVGNGEEPPAAPRGGRTIAMIPPPAVGDSRWTKIWFPPQSTNVIAGSRGIGLHPGSFTTIIEPSTGNILRRFQVTGELAAVASDGKTLASIDAGFLDAILCDNQGKELRRFHHEGKIKIATLCQDGKRLVTVNEKSEIKIWDTATGQEQRTIAAPNAKRKDHGRTVVSIAPDGNTLFVGTTGGDILRWNLRDGKELNPLSGHTWWVTGLFPTPDGRSLVSVSWDNMVHRWDLALGRAEPNGEGFTRHVLVTRSPDGRSIAAASCPGRLEFWDAGTGKRLRRFSLPARSFSRMRFSPDGKRLALACSDAKVRLWDISAEGVTRELNNSQPVDGYSYFEGLAWSPDGRFLAASLRGDGIRMWETTTGKEIWHEVRKGAIAFTPDGKTLVSGGQDRSLTFQDAATGAVRFTLNDNRNMIDGIAFSPDGGTLATCHHGGNVYLCDPKTGVVRKTLRAHRQVAWSISFSPNSKRLASSGDNTVCVWEVATGAEVQCLKGHEGRTYQVEFGADGRTVLSSSWDLTALLWDIRPRIEGGRKPSLELLWTDLAGEDAARAYRAVHQLAAIPNDAVPFMRKHLRPAPVVDEKSLTLLIADLDSEDFAKREKATTELQKFGECALPAYRKALKGKPSLESRRRLEDLLDRAQHAWRDISGERLRMLRAVEALELARTERARDVLKTLAAGASGARLTEEAKASLERLAKRERDKSP